MKEPLSLHHGDNPNWLLSEREKKNREFADMAFRAMERHRKDHQSMMHFFDIENHEYQWTQEDLKKVDEIAKIPNAYEPLSGIQDYFEKKFARLYRGEPLFEQNDETNTATQS